MVQPPALLRTILDPPQDSTYFKPEIFQGWLQPRPQGFSLKKWFGREKALASAGHVHSLNIPEKLIYMQPAGFALTEVENNGKY